MCRVLKLSQLSDFRSYFLSFDSGARLEIMNKPNTLKTEKQLLTMGYNHIAFRLGNKEAVDKLTEKLKNDGYNIVSRPRITGDGYYEICIIAFEDNLIELTE